MVTLTLDHWVAADRRAFRAKKSYIDGALKGETGIIEGVTEEHKEDIFYMLLFCLCVPQSKAIKAEEAILELRKKNFYSHELSLSEVIKILTGLVRFHPTKAKRLLVAKQMFLSGNFWQELKSAWHLFVLAEDKDSALQAIRRNLIRLVDGMGPKLAAHFMRNVGMRGLAILDVHVIHGLKKRGLIEVEKIGSSLSEYMDIEQVMKDYAQRVGISLDELDLLLWSQKTGYVFK